MTARIRREVFGATFFALLSIPGHGSVITYSSRALFNSAVPGLPVETFEETPIPPGTVTSCTGPLSNASGGCFPSGSLLPGVTYSAVPGPTIARLGANFPGVGNASSVIGPNTFADTFNLTFVSANAAGFDLFPGLAAGNVAISVFGPANSLLGSFLVNAPIGPTFFGVISDTGFGSIGRINVASQSASPGELIDNLAFGNAVLIPEPASVLLFSSAFVIVMASYRRIRSSTLAMRRSSPATPGLYFE